MTKGNTDSSKEKATYERRNIFKVLCLSFISFMWKEIYLEDKNASHYFVFSLIFTHVFWEHILWEPLYETFLTKKLSI